MIVSASHSVVSLRFELAALVVVLLASWLFCRWFPGRWDRLTRHRYVRWHRGEWRDNTAGHDMIYEDRICRCCRIFR